MRKNRQGLEVQFMDSIDAEISPDLLNKQLRDAFHANDDSTETFINSAFKSTENSAYDNELRKLTSHGIEKNTNAATTIDRKVIKDMRPKRHAKKKLPPVRESWLRRMWRILCK
jgi:hypothetical protein